MFDVVAHALLSRGFGSLERVTAFADDAGDAGSEARRDVLYPRLPSLILPGVVKQSRDRLVLRAAVLDHERSDGEEMREVGDRAPLARLFGVRPYRVDDRFFESGTGDPSGSETCRANVRC